MRGVESRREWLVASAAQHLPPRAGPHAPARTTSFLHLLRPRGTGRVQDKSRKAGVHVPSGGSGGHSLLPGPRSVPHISPLTCGGWRRGAGERGA